MVEGIYTEIMEVHQGAFNRNLSRLKRKSPLQDQSMKVLDMSWDENPKQSGTAKPTFCLCIFLYTEAEGFFL